MTNLQSVYQELLSPSEALIADINQIEGDIMILGAGGKMGPSLSLLAKETCKKAGIDKNIIAVARFSDQETKTLLDESGIETITMDLLADDQLQELPEVKNVLYLAGTKFGTKDHEPYTWTMNSYLPGRVANKFKKSNIVVFSTGNVYPFTSIHEAGAEESLKPNPVGEYGMSCLGRERIFQYFSLQNNTPVLIFRLNYAIDVTYGVLLEIGKQVCNHTPIDIGMGYVNVIWQQDANEIALRSLLHCNAPPKLLNVTGPEIISVQWIANEFGKRMNTDPTFINHEAENALLSNASECKRLFGHPRTDIHTMIDIISEWILQGGRTINKPTHFNERTGNF